MPDKVYKFRACKDKQCNDCPEHAYAHPLTEKTLNGECIVSISPSLFPVFCHCPCHERKP